MTKEGSESTVVEGTDVTGELTLQYCRNMVVHN